MNPPRIALPFMLGPLPYGYHTHEPIWLGAPRPRRPITSLAKPPARWKGGNKRAKKTLALLRKMGHGR